MSDLKPSNFKLKKFKSNNSGVEVVYEETIVISDDVATVNEVTKKSKDSPDPELTKKFQEIAEVVKYDEGYSDDEEINVLGISINGKDGETAVITHNRKVKSGVTGGRNSGRIHKESEEFEKAKRLFDLIDELSYFVYQFVVKHKRSQLELFNPDDTDEETVEDKKMEVA